MTAIAQEIDEKLQQLDPATAERLANEFRKMLAEVSLRPLTAEELEVRRNYKTETYRLGVRPGIDIDKIGQLIDEIDPRPLG
jgi:hypothetical protein